MPIVVNSPLKSSVANATFFDKTIDDTTIGIVSLANLDALSGSTIVNLQREINLSRKIIFSQEAKADGETLTPDAFSLNQEFRLVGAAAPATLDNNPFTGVKVVEDGCEIAIVGHDDTNTVTINHNDADYGCLLNGNATLKRGYTIKLTYNDELKRYIETGRNF